MPGDYLRLPVYQLRLLIDKQPALDAAEQQALAVAVASPHMKPEGRRSYLRLLRRIADPPRSQRREPRAVIEHDPEKAAAWFAEMGVRVH